MSKITVLLRKNAVMNTVLTELGILRIWKRNRAARPTIRYQADNAIKVLEKLDPTHKHIFFVGIPMHKNIGDQAQKYCIEKWVKENYSEYDIVRLPTWPFYDKQFKARLEQCVAQDDMFVIQSGYCTTSWHHDHPMHLYIVKTFKENPVLIMPQTVLFSRKSDPNKTRRIFKTHGKLLFLARDRKSYEDAKRFFPETTVCKFPDIVTTLIGSSEYENSDEREGVLICVRNDSEKLYSNEAINQLAEAIQKTGTACEIADTNSDLPLEELQENFGEELRKTIDFFGRHKVIITDRYHGTIFSMISNTPVIVLATLDHKVKTGTEWFEGIYDGSYYNADSLDEAFRIAMKVLENYKEVNNEPYFKINYYDKLKGIFDEKLAGGEA